jgi:hypothetical protein
MQSADDEQDQGATCRRAPVTNQLAFEQHRYYLELRLKRARPIPPCASYVDPKVHYTMYYTAEWMGRYMRRRDAIEGVYDGPLADFRAKQLLIARHRARDADVQLVPNWDPFVLGFVNMCLKNNRRTDGRADEGLDVSDITQPHGYGSSLRALWGQAQRLGRSEEECWEFVLAWSRHRPACWDREDERKRDRQPQGPPPLVEHLARRLTWKRTDDLDHPWATSEGDGRDWLVRLNDFPDDVMYSLVIDGTTVHDFHNWPATWQRDWDRGD